MVDGKPSIKEMAAKVEDLKAVALELMEESEDFPALNRNLKRVLASIAMLQINLEETA
jgi:regulator of replication initiation timing